MALVYISHKMDEIKVIADEVTIMRDGHYIGKWDVASMTKEQIIAKMVGRELSNLYPPAGEPPLGRGHDEGGRLHFHPSALLPPLQL